MIHLCLPLPYSVVREHQQFNITGECSGAIRLCCISFCIHPLPSVVFRRALISFSRAVLSFARSEINFSKSILQMFLVNLQHSDCQTQYSSDSLFFTRTIIGKHELITTLQLHLLILFFSIRKFKYCQHEGAEGQNETSQCVATHGYIFFPQKPPEAIGIKKFPCWKSITVSLVLSVYR